MKMNRKFLLVLATPLASAYLPLHHGTRCRPFVLTSAPNKESIEATVGEFDLERAKECAEHFGRCSVEEMEKLKEGLRKERLRKPVSGKTKSDTEDNYEYRVLEEELELQMRLLKEENPEHFVLEEDPTRQNRRLKEETSDSELDPMHFVNLLDKAPDPSPLHFIEEGMLVLEEEAVKKGALVICAVVALTFLAFQILPSI